MLWSYVKWVCACEHFHSRPEYRVSTSCDQSSCTCFALHVGQLHFDLKLLERFIINFCICQQVHKLELHYCNPHTPPQRTGHRAVDTGCECVYCVMEWSLWTGCLVEETGHVLDWAAIACLCLCLNLGLAQFEMPRTEQKIIKNAAMKNKFLFIWLSCQINHKTRQIPKILIRK